MKLSLFALALIASTTFTTSASAVETLTSNIVSTSAIQLSDLTGESIEEKKSWSDINTIHYEKVVKLYDQVVVSSKTLSR